MSESACGVLKDGSALRMIQSTSNRTGSIEGHTIRRTPEICFGAICDVKAKLFDTPEIFEACTLSLAKETDHQYYEVVIVRRESFYILQSANGTDIAVLNKHTTRCLQDVQDQTSVRYESFIEANEWTERIKVWNQTGKPCMLALNVVVYGSHPELPTIGTIFSKARLYFQHPIRCPPGIEYNNPHYLSFSEITGSSVDTLAASSSTQVVSMQPQYSVLSCLEDLHQPGSLRSIQVNSSIQTKLLVHQRKGVDYIEKREAGTVFPKTSLWKLVQNGACGSFYEHVITGTRRPKLPESPLGGILADEMGLGKSLTILSAIVGSLSKAEEFSHSRSQGQKRTAKATLIIAPSVLLMDGWVQEVQKHILPNILTVHKYHGPKRETDLTELRNFDIVFTTYATIAAEFCKGVSLIHQLEYYRLVLDEAHSIRHQETKQFRAVSTISAKFRWCLTGTPIQNSLCDLGALIKFLRVPQLETTGAFRYYIINPIESNDRTGFENLRHLLEFICLRRTSDILGLPKPTTNTYFLELSAIESEEYSSVGETCRQEIDKAVSGRHHSKAYSGILQAILALRLLCNHGTHGDFFQSLDGSLPSDPDEAISLLQQSDNAVCTYCSCDVASVGEPNDLSSGVLTVCSHIFCADCLPQYKSDLDKVREGAKAQCPVCNRMIGRSFLVAKAVRNVQLKPESSSSRLPAPLIRYDISSGISTKISSLIQDIECHLHTDKSIVFSTWKKSLELVARLLAVKDIPFVSVDGSISLKHRRKVLLDFQENSATTILLMTLGTGAMGLNLTAASRIHILEPQWNPSVETQAVGRAVRLGQEKQVTIIRYIIKNTVEEYIQSHQSRKLQLASVGWEKESEDKEDQKLKKIIVNASPHRFRIFYTSYSSLRTPIVNFYAGTTIGRT